MAFKRSGVQIPYPPLEPFGQYAEGLFHPTKHLQRRPTSGKRKYPMDHSASNTAAQGQATKEQRRTGPAFLFDLDGTLVDSVYQHVLAWREALEAAGIELAVWRIHRRIGMSGGLFLNALLRETSRLLGTQEATNIRRWRLRSERT